MNIFKKIKLKKFKITCTVTPMDKKAMIRVHVHLILHQKKILLRDDNIREVEISNMFWYVYVK